MINDSQIRSWQASACEARSEVARCAARIRWEGPEARAAYNAARAMLRTIEERLQAALCEVPEVGNLSLVECPWLDNAAPTPVVVEDHGQYIPAPVAVDRGHGWEVAMEVTLALLAILSPVLLIGGLA